jgi:hypothetical protein
MILRLAITDIKQILKMVVRWASASVNGYEASSYA